MENMRAGGVLITKIHQVAGRIFQKKLKEHGLDDINPGQGRILFALWEEDNISIRQLAQKTLLEKSTLTAMLDRLQKEGFVERVASERDRRVVLIRRTEKDRAFQKLYLEVSEEMIALFYEGIPEKEITVFEGLLKRILYNLVGFETGAK